MRTDLSLAIRFYQKRLAMNRDAQRDLRRRLFWLRCKQFLAHL